MQKCYTQNKIAKKSNGIFILFTYKCNCQALPFDVFTKMFT